MPRIPAHMNPAFEHTFAVSFVLERHQEKPLLDAGIMDIVLPSGRQLVWLDTNQLQVIAGRGGEIVSVAASRADVLVTIGVNGRSHTASGPWLLDQRKSEMLVPIPLRVGDMLSARAKSLSFEKLITGQFWMRCRFNATHPY